MKNTVASTGDFKVVVLTEEDVAAPAAMTPERLVEWLHKTKLPEWRLCGVVPAERGYPWFVYERV